MNCSVHFYVPSSQHVTQNIGADQVPNFDMTDILNRGSTSPGRWHFAEFEATNL